MLKLNSSNSSNPLDPVLIALNAATYDEKMAAALRLSHDERRVFYDRVRVMHPRLRLAREALRIHTKPDSGSEITLLIGPTGAGKSTIANAFMDQVLESKRAAMIDDQGLIPIIYLEAPATGEIKFSWKIFYQMLLELLLEPLMDRKILSGPDAARIMRIHGHSSPMVGNLRRALEKALRMRKTSVMIIDEAFHLASSATGVTLLAQLNGLKSLANLCGVQIVMIGSYDLIPVLEVKSELTRRFSVVHIARYRKEDSLDQAAFSQALLDLSRMLPLEDQPELLSYADPLMRSCIGLPGILKQTLQRALAFALDQGQWTESCLERALLTKLQVRTILADCLRGEPRLAEAVTGGSVMTDFEDDRMELELKEKLLKEQAA